MLKKDATFGNDEVITKKTPAIGGYAVAKGDEVKVMTIPVSLIEQTMEMVVSRQCKFVFFK